MTVSYDRPLLPWHQAHIIISISIHNIAVRTLLPKPLTSFFSPFMGGGGGDLNATLGLCFLVCGCLMCLLAVCFYRKALDNNDLNQVWLTSGFVKRRVCWGGGGGVLSLADS